MPGGVCAVLDYEVEHMTDYVAEMAVRVVMPESAVSDRFRKFVSQILTSTRLPSTTILLGMNYLAKRINTIKANPLVHGPYKASEGEVWRFLTVALLLASKFLDDNTFQNRSWSEVTSIPVSELNSLEFEWLAACHWQLYVNLDNTKDYQAWLEDWKSWQSTRKSEAEARIAQRNINFAMTRKLSELPAIQTAFSEHAHTLTSPISAYSSSRGSFEIARYSTSKPDMRGYDWPHTGYHHGQAPVTPPDSGYATPEHIVSASAMNANYNDWFSQGLSYNAGYQNNSTTAAAAAVAAAAATTTTNSNQMHGTAYYGRANAYANQYTYSPWDSGMSDCSCCAGCHVPSKNYFGASHAYNQAVVG
ncbi:hypothetical protein TD95_001730 [Thielaviopsis punctulata]|uniref:Cyclin N-terminal domain-containing protein n=1 Tax=Thielaviopsis punctulata TaxID=72032 RepID=A0A0F4ZBT2_9PEZI|nr:hypothetical protein TD95_001730 [Thielaviopsis punctulata]